MSNGFRPALRLRRHVEFQAVQQNGRRVAAQFLTMIARPNALGHDRFGIIASRRVGGAVVRNRAKRRLRDVFRRQGPDGLDPGARPLDIVVVARRETGGAPMAALEQDFAVALAKLRARYP